MSVYSLVKNIYNVNELHFTDSHCAREMLPREGHIWSARTGRSQSVNGLFFTSLALFLSGHCHSETRQLNESVKTSEHHVIVGIQAMP